MSSFKRHLNSVVHKDKFIVKAFYLKNIILIILFLILTFSISLGIADPSTPPPPPPWGQL